MVRVSRQTGEEGTPSHSSCRGCKEEELAMDTEKKQQARDLSGGPAVKTLCSQCRGPGFNPWSGN